MQSWLTGFSQRAVNRPHLCVREPLSHWMTESVSMNAEGNSSTLLQRHSPSTRHDSKSHSP